MAKSTLQNLDSGQLDFMWSMLRLGGIRASDHDVDKLIEYADKIRQALIQKTAGQRSNDPNGYVCFEDHGYVCFEDLGTYINLLVLEVLTLRVGGRLEMMYKEDRLASMAKATS